MSVFKSVFKVYYELLVPGHDNDEGVAYVQADNHTEALKKVEGYFSDVDYPTLKVISVALMDSNTKVLI